MGNKKDVLPIVVASAVALVITGIVRFFLPTGTVIKQQPMKRELSLPDIPLMIKSEQSKAKEIQVLVTSVQIKKDEKIVQEKLNWRTWPENAVQPNFIAQDKKGNPLNNKADHGKALSMWAKNDIPVGVPLNISMLTDVDPVEVANKERAAKEAAANANKTKQKKEKDDGTLIRVGYRAVPFQLNSRTPISTNMISPGDYVDVFINSFENNRKKTHIYKGMKIIAIDGVTKKQKEENKSSGGLFGGGGLNLSGLVSPKTITLEVKESLVNTMLKQAENNGITITLRSQKEVEESDGEEETEDNTASDTNLLRDIWEMTRTSSSDALRETAKKMQSRDRDLSSLLRDMNNLSMQSVRNNAALNNTSYADKKTEEKQSETKKEEPVKVKIYRKINKPEEVKFETEDSTTNGSSEGSKIAGNY